MHTIWLIPDAEQEASLRATIDRFARMAGSDAFAPHVTLLSGFASVDEAELAISRVQDSAAFDLPANGVSSSDEFFRAVVIELDVTRELRALRSLAAGGGGQAEASKYAPHLSLVYGALSAELRTRLVEDARANLPDSIRVARIDITRTSGPVREWETLVRCRLRG